MLDAFSYLRVSGRAQVDGDGFPRQRETIGRWSAANGLRSVEEFRDEGVSGTLELEGRDALAKLLDRVRNGVVKHVLVERSDRLARDLMVGEIILKQFRDAGATVIACDSGSILTNENSDPTRTLIRQVLGAVAEFEKSVLVAKLKVARQRKRAREGRCEGQKPFGTYPGEQPILDRIMALRKAARARGRRSYAEIASVLNAESIPTRKGNPWAPGTVARMIRTHRPMLAGKMK